MKTIQPDPQSVEMQERDAPSPDDGEEAGLLVFGDEQFNLRTDTYENLAIADTSVRLVPRDGTKLSVDAAVSGVGGTPVKPLKKYRVRPERRTFSVALGLYDPEISASDALARRSCHIGQ